MSTQELKDETKILQEYWNELPLIKKVNNKTDFAFLENENRFKIINVLSHGINDFNYAQSKNYIRHAFTIKEIKSQIKIHHNYSITEANIHFHIQKLAEKGFVKEVLEIETGRRPKKYYGRTAKIFLSSDESSETDVNYAEKDEFTKKLIELIVRINPSTSRKEILDKFNFAYKSKAKIDNEKIGKWMDQYTKDIVDSEIEFKELFLYISKAYTFNTEFLELYNFILETLKLTNIN